MFDTSFPFLHYSPRRVPVSSADIFLWMPVRIKREPPVAKVPFFFCHNGFLPLPCKEYPVIQLQILFQIILLCRTG